MAIAVIQGKSVAFSKGYGARVQGESATVDTSTVFQIGSISKSFTATVMGSLVDEGKAAFEDHVIDRYPGFQMYDPWVTREFMICDLMAQHSGMAPYAGDSAVAMGFTRQDFVNGLRHLNPSPASSEFGTSITLAGRRRAAGDAHGRKWEELVAQLVFTPLGMTSGPPPSTGAQGRQRGLPHILVDGVPTPTRADFWDIDAWTPSARRAASMQRARHASYVMAHLNQGAFRDKASSGRRRPGGCTIRRHHHGEGAGERPARGPRAGPMFHFRAGSDSSSPHSLVWHNGGPSARRPSSRSPLTATWAWWS